MKVALFINSIVWCFLLVYCFYALGLAILALTAAAFFKLLIAAALLAACTFLQAILGIAAH